MRAKQMELMLIAGGLLPQANQRTGGHALWRRFRSHN